MGRYVTPEMGVRLTTLNDYYRLWTGNHLSFNDASLPYGGFFGNAGGGGLDSRCHYSHRRGIDIDVNSEDWSGEYNLRTQIVERGGSKELLLNLVDSWSNKADLIRIL